jgi:four helix bundle protein
MKRAADARGDSAEEHRTSNVERRTSKEGSAPRQFDLEERLLDYAACVISIADALHTTRAANHVAGQLLRSGTAPLPNHAEAESAESINDFIHKLKICLKELRETRRWLRLIDRVPLIDDPQRIDAALGETEELIRIFVASIRTASANRDRPNRIREDADSKPSTLDVGCSKFDVALGGLSGGDPETTRNDFP